MDAPQGFEPRFAVPKTDVLPLDEGAAPFINYAAIIHGFLVVVNL